MLVVVRKRRRCCCSVEARVVVVVVPCWIRHCWWWWCWNGRTVAVVHEIVDMVRVGEGAAMNHGGLEVRTFGVLAFAFVRVLVAAEGLGGGEVAAAVVALEAAAALAIRVGGASTGGSGGVFLLVGRIEVE